MLLRNLLVDYDPEEPMIFGHRFKYFGVSGKDIKSQFSFHSLVKTVGLISARVTWLGVLAMFYPKLHSTHLLKVLCLWSIDVTIWIVDCLLQRWKVPRSVLTQDLSGVERMSEWVGFCRQCDFFLSLWCTIAGQCMTKLNVTVGDSRDSGGRAR